MRFSCLTPNNCPYHIARIFAGRGQFPAAIREYQLALRYTANRNMKLLCLTELAETQLQTGDPSAAQDSIGKALRIDPSNSAALELREQILHKKGSAH